ncbi:hypothetical protein LTR99_003813 [Exophiala xenobiotica]|uniref:Uncharacterized protein n=1 Tax=Vermiconidia calcicola TaxID=1690605 RepID=A0AAV9Q2C7_9PEZI|nr:hypothetical protein LTR41_007111 [Exophiala xenobiotica]KAK5531506.1 hypothetical protein LTR25_008615 [Vermiconidia calcicola]KAK5544707.1 hypothetical protein LTR23_004147 [Chaetothyriales sp. CCFEE 6169]KAK5227514.1 hypothetical protein LTR47_008792 [Exophiala xenobiotica]KAK5253280.1 hypothetical protein LTS06_002244 [Exophiala xenobiotica]
MACLAGKRAGVSFALHRGYAWQNDVVKEEDARRRELANNAPTIMHGRTLVFGMPEPQDWQTLNKEQKFQKKREYLCERYGEVCFVFEEDRPQLRNPIARILVRKNQYYAHFEAWYAENFESQYHATMRLLEHGLKMELQDFINLHQSLEQDVAYGYMQARLEERGTSNSKAQILIPPNIEPTAVTSSTTLHGLPPPHKPQSDSQSNPQNNATSLNKKRTLGPDVSLDTAFNLARQAFLSTKEVAPSLKRNADGEAGVIETKKPKLGNGEGEPAWKARIKLTQDAAWKHRVHRHEPQQRAGTPGNQGLEHCQERVNTTHHASAQTPQLLRRDARPFTTILGSVFEERFQHEMKRLPQPPPLHRQKRLCTVYGQGLKDAQEAEDRYGKSFFWTFRGRVSNFCILAARYPDNNGNAYTRARIARKLASDIGVDLKTQPDLDWAVIGSWNQLFFRFMEHSVFELYRRGQAIGRPLDPNLESKFEAFRSMPNMMWPEFCNAMGSIEGQIQAREVF